MSIYTVAPAQQPDASIALQWFVFFSECGGNIEAGVNALQDRLARSCNTSVIHISPWSFHSDQAKSEGV